MNSKLLSFLEEIKAQGNMSKAAQALFVTQPYISRVIKNAEVNFGVRLIDRSSHPIQLTYAGEKLLDYLQEENKLRANLDREMTHLSEFKYGHLTIGSNEILSNDIYNPILIRFSHKYPKIHAQIIRMNSQEAEKRLISGSLDFFVGHSLSNPKVEYQPVAKIPLVLVIPETSGAYQAGQFEVDYNSVDFSKLSGESFVGVPQQDYYQRFITNFLNNLGISPEYSLEVPDIHLAADLAINGLGATVTPATFTSDNFVTEEQKSHLNLVRIPKDQLSADFGITFMKTKQASEPVTDLLSIITDVVEEFTPKD